MRGYVKNCLVWCREDRRDEIVFDGSDGRSLIATLDGYAIIPLSNYRQLMRISEEWSVLRLKALFGRRLNAPD